MISLRLFGGASLESDGAALTGPAVQRHRLALLSLLCLSHPRALSRDKLIGYLWPGRDADHGRNLLKQAVHVLRRTLGDGVILSAGDELRLGSPGLGCDVLAFQDALVAGDRERATGLYVGPLLDGFFLSDTPEFEGWVERERERLRQAWRSALGELAAEKLAVGQADAAVECWRRLLADDPYDARVTLGLMQALESAGDRAGALRQAQLHGILLAQDFETGPDPAVHALAERIRAGGVGDDASPPGAEQSAPAAAVDVEASDASPVATVPADGMAAAGLPRRARWSARRLAGVVAVLVVLGSLAWMSTRPLASRSSRVTHIAVIPLANLTGDPEQEYFVAGMHDALISELAQIKSLTVYSRQSVLRYDGSSLPLPAIAEQLGADAVVEGTVFMSGDSVRISIQVVRAQPEEHLLSRTFTDRLDRALALQGRVARAIADAMRARVTPAVRARLSRNRSVNPVAQEAYLAGLYHLGRVSSGPLIPRPEALAQLRLAIAKLEQAVVLDSTWARAWAKLAQADHWLASSVPGEADEYYPRAKAAALRALQLDDTESQAYASLGFVLFRHEHDWAGAERAIRRAIDLDPNSHHWTYALYLLRVGRYDEAVVQYQMAMARDPVSGILKLQLAGAYGCADRHQEAIAQIRELQAREARPGSTDPGGTELLSFLVEEYAFAGAHAQSVATAERLVALTDTVSSGSELAFALALAGRRDEARSLVTRLEQNGNGTFNGQASVYAALGDTDRAVTLLTAVVDHRDLAVGSVRCWTASKLLRDDPRVQALIGSLGPAH